MDHVRSLLQSSLFPLPALDYLPQWSQIADIHLVSNHRSEWLSLSAVNEYIKSITISSDVGFCKPQQEIFEITTKKLNAEMSVLFVDDQEKNLRTAAEFGWRTLLADKQGNWISQVEFWLQGSLGIER